MAGCYVSAMVVGTCHDLGGGGIQSRVDQISDADIVSMVAGQGMASYELREERCYDSGGWGF